MMGIRPHSPGPQPAPWSRLQPEGPSPAKRRRLEGQGLADPETGAESGLEDAADPPAAPALTSMVILSENCALQLPLDGFSLVVEAMPDSVLQVTLQDHTVILVHQDLLGSIDQSSEGQSGSPDGLDGGALLGSPLENDVVVAVVEQQEICASVPEIAGQEEVLECDEVAEFLAPYMDPPAGFSTGLLFRSAAVQSPDPQGSILQSATLVHISPFESGSPGLIFDQDFHLVRPYPTSPLQPLPPFPSPGPHERPVRPPGPHRKARRRLFQV
ncbi:proline-rich protein 23A [Cavia porcellus]|uniref:proline-rich protein 23A n=1 Tax=Cavia porcellus TaxID=10141 RepID=UPI0003510FF9|nr:proline-rich protein 23A [Cavia porcellus]